MIRKIALIGNPNSGKTTLFNVLTGSKGKTGNWTGVTVEEMTENSLYDKDIIITDLPGLYSLSYKSPDEKVVYDYITNKNKPDVIINVVDGTNFSRNMLLTTELVNLNIPMIIAVNMCDELKKNNIRFNKSYLENLLNVKVVEISALKKINIEKLNETVKNYNKKPYNCNFNNITERYKFIDENIHNIIEERQTKAQIITEKADSILTNKIWGIPIYLIITFLIYFLSAKGGSYFGKFVESGIDKISIFISGKMKKNGMSEWIITLISRGILSGCGTIMSFIPQIIILFFFMGIMEESGYASRFVFLCDRLFNSLGLSGKSMIPFTLSCGCTVTGIMSTRGIENKKERILTIFLAPFMPCSAKSAVFCYLASILFSDKWVIPVLMYFIGIFAIITCGFILKHFHSFSDNQGEFIMEIPTLKIPDLKNIFVVIIEKLKEFILKAGMTIVIVSVVLWFMSYFGFKGYTNGKIENSFLYLIGNDIKYLFYPLGFANYQCSIAVLTGLFAREGVAETLNFLSSDIGSLFYNKYSAVAFMVFELLSPPCIATLTTIKSQLKDRKLFVKMIVFHFLVAYITAFIINITGIILSINRNLILLGIVGIILTLTVLLIFVLVKQKNKKEGQV